MVRWVVYSSGHARKYLKALGSCDRLVKPLESGEGYFLSAATHGCRRIMESVSLTLMGSGIGQKRLLTAGAQGKWESKSGGMLSGSKKNYQLSSRSPRSTVTSDCARAWFLQHWSHCRMPFGTVDCVASVGKGLPIKNILERTRGVSRYSSSNPVSHKKYLLPSVPNNAVACPSRQYNTRSPGDSQFPGRKMGELMSRGTVETSNYHAGFCVSNPNIVPSSKRRATTGVSVEIEKDKEGEDARKEAAYGQQPELQFYNTMSKQKEIFRPKTAGKVSMYVCGVTAYDYSHIGHARVYVAFDVLFRYLKYLGYEVNYVRNFTDVDDKIITRAKELGEDPVELSRRFCEEFHVDMASLQCLLPSVEPRVTDHVPQIIKMILQIIKNGHGYVMEGGDVYFSVESFPGYGSLSGRKLDENRAGERVAVDTRKHNPADFALWKSAKPGEPSWDSPWGPGRPGWHIECSAMSAEHLGHAFDIHGGGMDLIFPHHENEIAQSCAACAESQVGYWLHNGFVTVDAEKMSKSLGNFFTIREVLQVYHPLALRLFLLGTQYRSPINYSKRQLEQASDRLFYFCQALADCDQVLSEQENPKEVASKETMECVKSLKAAFCSSMADDLHTPIAVAALSEPFKVMNDLMHTRKGRKDKTRLGSLQILKTEVQGILNILGLWIPSYAQVLDEIKEKTLKRAGMTPEDLVARLQERAAARVSQDYARSDQIRAELSALGIALMDGGDGTQWRPGAITEDLCSPLSTAS